jgi:catechol 2,3-dioxygenase-like lactoylglutathione lyase family enzyme
MSSSCATVTVMRGRTSTTRWSTVLDSGDAKALARFYRDLLGWRVRSEEPGWVTIEAGDGGGYLAFQTNDTFVPPVWPAGEGDQQMQIHLDIEVRDLDAAVQDALALGARLADHQPNDDVRVLIDPAGHVFDLWLNREEPA